MTRAATGEPTDGGEAETAASGRPGFAHASEAEFARILDFYQVAWRYEPHAFPILWSLDGDVLESFAPDFYLPELDLYVEMTTLRQKLVRKKNRKLRRLRELYPDVRIKLFYARDFRALMLKYGRVALADALSGAEGQFTPDNRGPAAEPITAGSAPRPSAVPEGPAAPSEPAPPAASRARRPARSIAPPSGPASVGGVAPARTGRSPARGTRRRGTVAPPVGRPDRGGAPERPIVAATDVAATTPASSRDEAAR